MPVHGEFRMLAAHAQLAREGGIPATAIMHRRERQRGRARRTSDGARIVDHVDAGMTFVDGLGVGDVHDVALRDRRRLAEDGVLIVVATLAASNGAGALTAPPELIVARLRRGAPSRSWTSCAQEAAASCGELLERRHHRDQAAPGAPPRRARAARLRPHAPPADDPAGARRGLTMGRRLRYVPTWADVLEECAVEQPTARALVAQLGACEAAALAFCRLLERWARGDAAAADRGRRGRPRCGARPTASRRRSPGSTSRSTAICSSWRPTSPRAARGTASRARRSWSTGSPCSRARACASAPERVAQAYLELAVLVRALEGLTDAVRIDAHARPRVALGRALRPAREPARPRARRPARARGPLDSPRAVRAHRRRVDQPRPRRAAERLPRPGETVTGATFVARPRRQGREPGGRRRASRRRGDAASRASATTSSAAVALSGLASAGVEPRRG